MDARAATVGCVDLAGDGMKGRWSLYRDIRQRLDAAGLTPEQAAEAARLADIVLRERRDECIVRARLSGMGVRAIARTWGLSHVTVLYVLRDDKSRGGR